MGLIDGLAGGLSPMSMIPGMQMLELVSKGLELMKGLFEKGDLQGTQKMLDFLNEIITKQGGQNGQPLATPSESQPFNPPKTQHFSGTHNHQDFTIRISAAKSNAQPVAHATLPSVDGSPQGDQKLSDAARSFVDGSDAAKNRALKPGSDEWTTVMWAMQQNPNVRYDADNQRFTMKMSDGSQRDLCSLQEAQDTIKANGGFNRGNPTGTAALGDLLNEKTGQAQQSPGASDFVLTITQQATAADPAKGADGDQPSIDDVSKKVDQLKAQLKQFEEALRIMQEAQNPANRPGSLDVQVNVLA